MATGFSQVRFRRGFAANVCQICYNSNPADEDLMRVRCRVRGEHRGPEPLVTWSEKKGSLVTVRPLPNPPLPYGKYVRCSRGILCPGYGCTYAHSDEELVVWNNMLEERRQRGPIFSMPLPQPASFAAGPAYHQPGSHEGKNCKAK